VVISPQSTINYLEAASAFSIVSMTQNPSPNPKGRGIGSVFDRSRSDSISSPIPGNTEETGDDPPPLAETAPLAGTTVTPGTAGSTGADTGRTGKLPVSRTGGRTHARRSILDDSLETLAADDYSIEHRAESVDTQAQLEDLHRTLSKLSKTMQRNRSYVKDLMKRETLNPTTLDAVDTVCTTLTVSWAEVRDLIRNVVLDKSNNEHAYIHVMYIDVRSQLNELKDYVDDQRKTTT
jgi:hypothetical protein